MTNYSATSSKDNNTALILCAIGIVGIAGLHYFYTGKIGKGILYLLTGGLFLIGTIIDLISIAGGKFRDCDGKLLSTPASRQKEEEEAAARKRYDETHKKLFFSVAGVTFNNDDGSSRQSTLKRKIKESEMSVVNVTLVTCEVEGSSAVAVKLDGEQVGFVPKAYLDEVLSVVNGDKKIKSLSETIEKFNDDEGKTVYRCDIYMCYEK